jgi:hypothetical protein
MMNFGAWSPDIDSVGTKLAKTVLNALPTANGYGPFASLDEFTNSLPSRCLGYICVTDSSNEVHMLAGTATKLYKLNATTIAWADVSGAAYAVTDRDMWSFAQFGDNIIAVTNGTNPQRYQIGVSATFANLGGSPPQARAVSVIGDFLVLYLKDRVMWSSINNITGWTIGVNSCDEQTFPGGGYLQIGTNGEFGFLFQDRAIRRMIFNPGPTIFDISEVSTDRGILMPYSLIEAHSSTFFLSSDGFWSVDQSGAFTPIGDQQVNTWILANADLSNPRFMVGAADPKLQNLFWAFKSINTQDANIFDMVIIYNRTLGRFAIVQTNLEFVCNTIPLDLTLDGLDAIYPSGLDSIPTSLDSFESAKQGRISGFSSNHKLGFFTGAPLEAIVETAEVMDGSGKRLKAQYIQPISDTDSCFVSIGHRERLQDLQVFSTERAPSARSGIAGVSGSGRYISAKVRIPAGASWTYIRGVDATAATGGGR